MRPVSGFLSNDGNFFELRASANKHDAEMAIRAYCVEQNVDADKLVSHIEALADPILEFVNASRKEQKATKSRASIVYPEPHHARGHQADNSEREESTAPILEQSVDGHEPVPDMGSGSLAEKL